MVASVDCVHQTQRSNIEKAGTGINSGRRTFMEGMMTIERSKGGGFVVKSKSGKNLSKPGISHKAAERRIRQVEFYKHRKR